MTIDRRVYLQFRVRPDAPWYVKDSATAVCQNFIRNIQNNVIMVNNTFLNHNHLFTDDSDIKITLLKDIKRDVISTKFYELCYRDNRHKSFVHTDYVSDTADYSSEDLTKYMNSSKFQGDLKSTVEYLTKLSAIYPLAEDSIQEWMRMRDSQELNKVMVSEYILNRLVPCYILKDQDVTEDDMIQVYQDLIMSSIYYMMQVGYYGIQKFYTNDYIPVYPDTSIQIKHVNVLELPEDDVVGIFYGIEVGDKYFYGGDYVRAKIRPGNQEVRKPDEEFIKKINQWVTDRTDRYINYLKREGVNAIAVHPGHIFIGTKNA